MHGASYLGNYDAALRYLRLDANIYTDFGTFSGRRRGQPDRATSPCQRHSNGSRI